MTVSGDDTDRQFVTALARGLEILRCFDRPRLVLSVSEIARLLGLSQPTVWRLCYTLLKCGYLVRASSGSGMCIGAPAITLGYAAAQGQDARSVALPYLRRIVDEIGASATLSLRIGDEMTWIEQVDGNVIVRDHAVGWRAPLDTVAAGLAVLAALPPAERDQAIARMAAVDPARCERHRARIEEAVVSLAQKGFVALDTILGGQYAAVAVPLFETGTAPDAQWSLACGGLVGSWDETGPARAAQLLMEIRATLSPAFAALHRPSVG